jgi:hypothetical protein
MLFIFLCPINALAGPVVYPVKEVVGFNNPSLDAKAPAFAGWLKETGIPRLSGEFVAAVRKEFGPIAVDTIDAKNKHRVLVASLHLVRVSQYMVPKKLSRCTEYQLPITLSLVFTNPSTGDIIYSFTDTSYAPVELHDSEPVEQCDMLLRAATSDNYNKLLSTLIHKARQGYNPAQIEASVAQIWKGLYILDKGSKFGIARDDSLIDSAGNEIQVKYVTEDYAVAIPLLVSKVATGQKFSKYADQTLIKTIKKPKVISMHDGWGDDQLKTIAGYFDSELSKESAFTLLPVNESFSAVLNSLARETDIGQFQVTNQRALPDYLIKFGYSAPRIYNVSQEGKFGFQVYEQYVLGELLDKQGRIIYSAVAGDRIEDKDVGGMVFSKEARLEILLKNAVKRLAEQFSQSIKFSSFKLPVTKVEGNAVNLEDAARQLRPGNTVQIYRKIGGVSGISGEVMVPIWLAEVSETAGVAVRAKLLLPLSNEVREVEVSKNDVVIIDSISAGNSGESSTSVTYCKEISPKLGALEIDDFPVLSRGFGYLLPYSLYDNDTAFFDKVTDAVKYGGFNNSSLKLGQVNTAGRCLLPVYKSVLENRLCENGDCDASVRLAAGYRLYLGQDKKGGAASETKLSIKQVREPALDPVIQGEVSKNALGLLKDNIVKVRYQ